MNKIFKRFIAYIIDMLIISLIVSILSNTPVINKQINNYNKYYQEYNKNYKEYVSFTTDLSNYYQDKKLTEKEYNKLLKKHKSQTKLLNKYYQDKKLSKSNYDKLVKEINHNYQKDYQKESYYLNKYSIINNIIYIIVILSYFMLFNIFVDGQTLGKLVMKLKIVNNDNEKNKVSILNYLIRTLVLYNPFYYLLMILIAYLCNINNYYNYALIASNFNVYLEIIIVLTIIMRQDNRGLHEILSHTKVISLNDEKQNSKDSVIEGDTIDTKDKNTPPIKKQKNPSEDIKNVEIIKNNKEKKKQSRKRKKIIIEENEEK